MKDYSIIIVGGGIAGLYTACKLQDNGITDILIIEKSDKLGGRIQTIKYKKTIYEAGAARFSKYHIELIKLLKELNLYGKKNRLDNKFTYIDRHSNILPNKFLPILKNIIRDSKKITKSEFRAPSPLSSSPLFSMSTSSTNIIPPMAIRPRRLAIHNI